VVPLLIGSPISSYIKQLKNEVEWINKFREMGFEDHQYSNLNVVQISVINSEHRSVFCALCAHLEEASISVLLLMSRECVQLKYHDVLDLFHQLGDFQMLLGRDGQLYVIDPLNIHPLSSEILNPSSQKTRKNKTQHRDTVNTISTQ
jgi:hypothetical protein